MKNTNFKVNPKQGIKGKHLKSFLERFILKVKSQLTVLLTHFLLFPQQMKTIYYFFCYNINRHFFSFWGAKSRNALEYEIWDKEHKPCSGQELGFLCKIYVVNIFVDLKFKSSQKLNECHNFLSVFPLKFLSFCSNIDSKSSNSSLQHNFARYFCRVLVFWNLLLLNSAFSLYFVTSSFLCIFM